VSANLMVKSFSPKKLQLSPVWFIPIFKNEVPYISLTDDASNFKFGMQLKFVKVYHKKITSIGNSGPGLGLR